MSLKDTLKKVREKLGDAGKDLAAELEAAAESATSDLDEARKEAAEASKKLKAAEKDRDKFRADIEAKAKGEGDEVSKLRAERDQLKAAIETHAAEKSELHRDYKLRESLAKAGLRDPDAIKMLDTSTVTVDDKGNLMGLDKALKSWKEGKPYLFEEPQSGHTGDAGGKPPRSGDGKGGQPTTKEPTADDRARQMLIDSGYLAPPTQGGGTTNNGTAGATPWGF